MRTLERRESGLWACHTRVEKFEQTWTELGLTQDQWDDFVLHHEIEPYDVVEVDGNLLVTAGLNLMLSLLTGQGGSAFSSGNAHLGVGDSNTAAAVGQTDLQAATNKTRAAMVGGYPTAPASGAVQFRSDFSGANYVWNEWGTFNANSAGTMLNRKVENLGTKASGVWTLTVTITIT
jgi:hypothetical protein